MSGNKCDLSKIKAPTAIKSMPLGNEIEEKLRRRLAFHFMNPVEKFIARRQVPWKLLLQFLKVILVTAQLLEFGYYRYAHSNYYNDNRIGFEHLFLRELWDPVREINTYPPSTGPLALYDKETFYKMFDSTIKAFVNVENITVNPIFRNSSFGFCIESFKGAGQVTKHLIIPPEMDMQNTETNCIMIGDDRLDKFDSKSYLQEQNFKVPWDTMNRMYFNFSVTTVTYRRLGTAVDAKCFRFQIMILFDNSDHDGQITLSLEATPEYLRCGTEEKTFDTIDLSNDTFLNTGVVFVCLMSLILCARGLYRAQMLRIETQRIFKNGLKYELTYSEAWQFLNLWYVLICINDLLLITGSVITELLETQNVTKDLWDLCSIFLGTGNLLVWIGMLRYLGFFPTYNALILTLKGAFPNVARFVICAGLVYAGFTFCGWIVFSPYHFKFKTLGSTSECLFSLINGDDMFATFSMLSQKLELVHGFSRMFLYTFVILFIYVVLSLFIAIIMDTYEGIKEYYKVGFPCTRMDNFYRSVQYDPYSDIFIDGSSPSLLYNFWAWVMFSYYGKRWQGYQRYCKSNYWQCTKPNNLNILINDAETISYKQNEINDV